ncbi:MAG: hypothetical protein QXW00_02400 [Candidatus Woesearchaeota archaeon]
MNSEDFKIMREQLAKFEERRDELIAKSRELIRLSKKVIYSVHRGDSKNAASSLKELEKRFKELNKSAKLQPELFYSGLFKSSVQEYVEAACFYSIIEKDKLPTHKELNVMAEHYLLGICDLVGELSRKAINSAAESDYSTALKIKKIVSDIYDELMQFDFSNGELRKKFDGIKYEVKRLEEMGLQLSIRNKN